MTYARVATGASSAAPVLRPVEAGIAAFLGDHIESLFAMARKPDATPPGRFIRPEAATLFRDLHTGTDQEFTDSAAKLTSLLIGRMNGTTAEGLLICLRAETGAAGRVAGALKLHVDAPNGAVLEALDSGEVVLAAVKDMMEKPGDLQKAALVASSFPDGQVLCGDRLTHAARYFPRAFDIQIFSRPSEAVRAFFDAVAAHAAPLLTQVAEAWATLQPGPPRQVLTELGGKIPDLTPQIQADIAEMLENAPRPAARLETTRRVTEAYRVGDITVSGPIDAMRQDVRVTEQMGIGWQIIVEAKEKPLPAHH